MSEENLKTQDSARLEYEPKILKRIYQIKLEEHQQRLAELKNPKVVYVSDLVYCPMKRKFKLLYPELVFDFEPYMVLGDIVHKGLQTYLKDWNFEIEKEVEEKIIIDNEEYILKGRIDAFSKEFLVEIKSSRSATGIPHEHHLLQLKIYMAMTSVSKGILIYITNDRIVEYPVSLGDFDFGKLVRDFIYATEVPKWDWECRSCPFSKFCPFAK